MIEKQDFRHGAAMLCVLDDPRCREVRKSGVGYAVNGTALAFLKYSTKARSPWRFGFGAEEMRRLGASAESRRVAIGLICGGDGVCAITLAEAEFLMGGVVGWIAVRRRFHEIYGVSGPAGTLPRKVPRHRWPAIVFDEEGSDGHNDGHED